jgi:hypothetical protein
MVVKAAVDVELLEDAADVVLDRVLRDDQLRRVAAGVALATA